MEKRLIIAVAVSFFILMAFQFFGPKKSYQKTPAAPSPAARTEAERPIEPQNEYEPAATGSGELETAASAGEETRIETENFDLVFTDRGGSLKKLYLKKYQDKEKEELLLSRERSGRRPFTVTSPVVKGLGTGKYRIKTQGGGLGYIITKPGQLELRKDFKFYKSSNIIDLEISAKNLSNNTITFSYEMVGPSGLVGTSRVAGRSFLQADSLIDGKVWKVKSTKGLKERAGNIIWSGLKNRYFTMIVKPFSMLRSVAVEQTPDKNLDTFLNSQQMSLAPGEVNTDRFLFYAGPLDEKHLEQIGYDMNLIVDYGFFGGVSKALLAVLRFFHAGVRNWGVAIILLTLLINLILFPLTIKSFTSMHQMKKIQPHMQKLKELHKDNPQKLNKEMMELYKKYNVNPLGGCLPLLLQMPIFIALYQGLMRSIELKGANFLWIKDLSSPDAVPIPFTLPLLGNSINILPLLMVGMMFVQQKISQGLTGGAVTAEQAQQQKMMMFIFPLFFGFLFYNMPSGLVLYWLTNTILMTTEQTFISKRMGSN